MEGANGKTRQEILSELRLPKEETRIREITQRTYASLKVKMHIRGFTLTHKHEILIIFREKKMAQKLI